MEYKHTLIQNAPDNSTSGLLSITRSECKYTYTTFECRNIRHSYSPLNVDIFIYTIDLSVDTITYTALSVITLAYKILSV